MAEVAGRPADGWLTCSGEPGVVGLGYVGLPVAVALAGSGISVVGFDIDPVRIAGLRAGRSGIDDVPDAAVTTPGLSFTADPADLEGLPDVRPVCSDRLREGMPDLGAVESATCNVAASRRPGDLVVLESTTYPGTTEEVVGPLLDAGVVRASDDHVFAT